MLDITQRQLADAVGVSRAHISAIESGRANPPLDLVSRIAEVLGVRLELVARPPVIVGGGVQRDLLHARCSGYVDRRPRAAGMATRREVEITHARSHGWIDLLAFDPRTRTLLIIEVKTRLDDLGEIERQLGWYERTATVTAIALGWKPRIVQTWLLMLATEDVDASIQMNRDVLARAFPLRAPSMLAVVAGSVGPAGVRGLALIDPSSRRRDWLIRTRPDGRRSPAVYRDRADAVRRFATLERETVRHGAIGQPVRT